MSCNIWNYICIATKAPPSIWNVAATNAYSLSLYIHALEVAMESERYGIKKYQGNKIIMIEGHADEIETEISDIFIEGFSYSSYNITCTLRASSMFPNGLCMLLAPTTSEDLHSHIRDLYYLNKIGKVHV